MFYFTDDCLTGIEQIDADHRKLFELMNQVMDLLGSRVQDKYNQVKDVFDELQAYADHHFIREEAHMAAINDPEIEFQKKQHMEFRQKISEMTFRNIDEFEAQEGALKELMVYLTRWLYQHILSSDILIGKMPPLKEWLGKDNPCVFTDEYRTGIELVDREHEMLFQIIAEATNLVKDEMIFDKYDEIMAIINRLREYTEEHFGDEEEYMESIGYSGLEAQKRAHQTFITKLREINLDEIDENQQEYLEELMEFLFGWLSNHILRSDKMIRAENES